MGNSKSRKRWGYVVWGTVILLFAGLIYVWSLFRAPLSEAFPDWDAFGLSLVFTISMICFCLGGFFGGRMARKLRHRVIILLGAAFLFAGFTVSSYINCFDSQTALVMLVVFYGVFCGLGSGFVYNAVLSSVITWFPDKPAAASGIMLFGFGAGSLVLGSLISMMIASTDVFNALFWVAVAVAAVLIAGSFFIKADAAAVRSAGTGEDGRKQYTVTEMLKTRSFWLFFLWVIVANAAGLMVINSAADIATTFGIVAILGMLVSVMNGAGRIFYGFMFDRFGRKVIMTLNSFILLAAALLLLSGCLTDAAAVVLIGMLVTGLAYSCSPTASAGFINAYYGSKNYADNLAVVNFSLIPASLLGPLLSSSLQVSGGGNYDTTFIMMVVLAVIVIVLNLILGAAARKDGFGN